MEKVTIRNAIGTDSEQIVSVLFRSWCATYEPLGVPHGAIVESFGDIGKKVDQFTSYLSNFDTERAVALVAVKNTEVVGLCFAHKTAEHWLLTQLYVEPKCFAKGIGSSLMLSLLEQIDSDVQLSVVKNNKLAIDFYIQHGFQLTDDSTEFKVIDSVKLPEVVMRRPRQTPRIL